MTKEDVITFARAIKDCDDPVFAQRAAALFIDAFRGDAIVNLNIHRITQAVEHVLRWHNIRAIEREVAQRAKRLETEGKLNQLLEWE